VVSRRLLSSCDVWGCLTFGAFLAVLDWAGFTILPMWGTAQSFSRCWSSYPQAIAFTSVTGITGVAFVLAATQALVVMLVSQRRQRVASIAALVIVIGVVAAIDFSVALQKPVGHIKVGAVGWVSSIDTPLDSAEGFERLWTEPVSQAASQGARLVVSPETAFSIYDGTQAQTLSEFIELSGRDDIYLAVGYFDHKAGMNFCAFVGPTEGVMCTYAKTHLVPFEHYRKGTGQPEIIQIDGVSVGAMICQDDNYTDIARRYGNRSTSVVAIPTNDWRSVRSAHFQNTIHRAIECHFAIVRAASNGISEIVSPKGKILASKDHFADGADLIVADVPVYADRTIFSRFGHWFVLASGGLLVYHILRLHFGRLPVVL
jgi:apolipoprotein N-acyltransferase